MLLKKLQFFILFFFIAFLSHSQSPSAPISLHSFNHKYLEHLIKEKIDSVREAHELLPLANDSILYVAANDHAEYLLRTGHFSHNERNTTEKKTPQDRAVFHGAVNYAVGENIIKSYANLPINIKGKKDKTYINLTYNDLAHDFMDGWVNSPGHYANIITPGYQVTGVAISWDSQKGLVYAVQKFATIHFKYYFDENKEFFDYSNYVPEPVRNSFDGIEPILKRKKFDWKIKPAKDSLTFCNSCNNGINASKYKHKLLVQGRKLVFYTPDVKMMYDVIKNRRDGLALEIVEYMPYDCGNPAYYEKESRRNKQSIFNGEVLRPKYKRHIKKTSFKKTRSKYYFKKRKNSEGESFEAKLGRLPKDASGYVEVNVLFLKKNKLCRIMHFSGICGEKFDTLEYVPYFVDLDTLPYEFKPIRKEIKFEIPFEKGKHEYSYEDVRSLMDSLSYGVLHLDTVDVKAYSSLEGDSLFNAKLQRNRAKTFCRFLKSNNKRNCIPI